MFAENKKSSSSSFSQQNTIAQGTTFTGDLISEGDFRIEGVVNGSLTTSGKVVIGKTGAVEGGAEVDEIRLIDYDLVRCQIIAGNASNGNGDDNPATYNPTWDGGNGTNGNNGATGGGPQCTCNFGADNGGNGGAGGGAGTGGANATIIDCSIKPLKANSDVKITKEILLKLKKKLKNKKS